MALQQVARDQCCLCGKKKEQVQKLIVGLHGAVCVGCIELCSDIIRSGEPIVAKSGVAVEGAAEGYTLSVPADIATFFPDEDELLETLRYLTRVFGHRAIRLALDQKL